MLEVLSEGEPRLLARARKRIGKSAEKLGLSSPGPAPTDDDLRLVEPEALLFKHRVVRLFVGCFRATDIAEPLRSFDSTSDAWSETNTTERSLAAIAFWVRISKSLFVSMTTRPFQFVRSSTCQSSDCDVIWVE